MQLAIEAPPIDTLTGAGSDQKFPVNGKHRQSSDLGKLIWSVAECIAHLSKYETLEPGDIVMTGTPEGVNAVVAGDRMQGAITGLGEIEVRVEH